jgi:protein-S-isoprenylcysteine O-methyltransferase Ste14
MTDERLFQIALCILYTCYTVIRIRYHRRASSPRSSPSPRTLDAQLLRALIPFQVTTMFIYVFALRWLAWAALPFPTWLRWIAAIPGGAALVLLVWAHDSLGDNFGRSLSLREGHTLVTDGPYRWVRHPMYTAFYLLHLAAFLLSANGFIGLTWFAGLTAVIAARVPREERMMVEAFGAAYQDYAARTGRFLPRPAGPLLAAQGPQTRPERIHDDAS